MKQSKSNQTFLLLILLLAIVASINVFLPQGFLIGDIELPASQPIIALVTFVGIIIIYGFLGLIGLHLSKKLDFENIWSDRVTNKQRFIYPFILGIIIGIFFIICDIVFSKFNTVGHLPHPPFPTSITASITAGIGEEIIFRLFFITFWLWLISSILFKGKARNVSFWIITFISAIAFSIGHLPSVMYLFGYSTFNQLPTILLMEIILLNGVLSFFAAFYFKKYGLLAAIGIHFWTDIIWHVVYGFI